MKSILKKIGIRIIIILYKVLLYSIILQSRSPSPSPSPSPPSFSPSHETFVCDAQRPMFVQGQQNQGFGNKKTLRQLFEVNPKKNRY